jgi:hypothetical protein
MECINGINTFYWHQEQLCVFEAEGRVLTMFIVAMKCGLLGETRALRGKLQQLLVLCTALQREMNSQQPGSDWGQDPRAPGLSWILSSLFILPAA